MGWKHTGAFQAYAANLAGVTTDPAPGTGGVEEGRYLLFGSLVVVHFYFRWGTSASGGSGTYSLNLPVSARTIANVVRQVVGTGHFRDASATQNFELHPYLTDADNVNLMFGDAGAAGTAHGDLGSATHPSSTAPGADGDDLSVLLFYEAA